MLPDALGCVTDMDVAVAEPVAEPEPEPVSRDHGECLVTSAQHWQPACRGSSSETMDACASAELAVEAGWTVLKLASTDGPQGVRVRQRSGEAARRSV